MSSFLLKNKEKKTFEEKIRKLSRKTQDNIRAANNSFGKFCNEYYDNRVSEQIFEELSLLKENELHCLQQKKLLYKKVTQPEQSEANE